MNLKALRESNRLTMREAAPLLGLKLGQLARRESGEAKIKRSELPAISAAYKVPLEELHELFGFHSTRKKPRGIPVINRAPAGHVVAYDHDQYAEGEMHAAFEYIERDMETQDVDLFSVIVVGDSMQPSLFENDYLVLDPVLEGQEDRLRDGSIVFVRFCQNTEHRGGCVLGRMVWGKDHRTIRITKDNRNYPEIPVPFDSENIERISIAIQRRTKRL